MSGKKRDLQDMGLISLLSICVFGAGFIVGIIVGIEIISSIENWETLLGAIAALIAAAGTIFIINKQIKSTEKGIRKQIKNNLNIESNKLVRKSMSYRAILPSDLGSFCEYSKDCLSSLDDALKYIKFDIGTYTEKPVFTYPVLPTDVTKDIQNLIESAQNLNDTTVMTLVDLLSCYQIQKARFRNILERTSNIYRSEREDVRKDNFNSSLAATIELYLRAEDLFDFARMNSNEARLFVYHKDMLDKHMHRGMELERFVSFLDNINYIIQSGDWKHK